MIPTHYLIVLLLVKRILSISGVFRGGPEGPGPHLAPYYIQVITQLIMSLNCTMRFSHNRK